LDRVFQERDLETKISISEGGSIDRVYGFHGDPHGGQLRFWDPANDLYVGDLNALAPHVAAHGYWTEDTDQRLVETRQEMVTRMKEINPELEWWQSEYSFLGDGFRDGRSNLQDIDYGLFLAKVIHHDLTLGNASAWQYWETFSYGDGLRYKLVRVFNDQTSSIEKTGWALGHYSLFVRPGMGRVNMIRSDNATPLEAVDGILPSAYINEKTGEVAIVIINYLDENRTVKINLNESDTILLSPYRTSESGSENMFRRPDVWNSDDILLPARTITTFTAVIPELIAPVIPENGFSAAMSGMDDDFEVFDMKGRRIGACSGWPYSVDLEKHHVNPGPGVYFLVSGGRVSAKRVVLP
jgi:hypothetical protein